MALLAVLGSTRLHQQNFPLFLGVVLVVSILTVGVFLLTAADKPRP